VEARNSNIPTGHAPVEEPVIDAGNSCITNFEKLLDRCECDATEDRTSRQMNLTWLPHPQTAFAVTQYSKTLVCFAASSAGVAGYHQKIYSPVTPAVAEAMAELVTIVTFYLAVDENDEFFLIPLEEDGRAWNANLRLALRVAEEQPIRLLTKKGEDLCSVSLADVKIDVSVSGSTFKELLCEAFDGLVLYSFGPGPVSPCLIDGYDSREGA
jgi:hypothetical protein